MSDPFIGQITMFAGNFAPRNWGFCNGQLLPIAGNEALFSILGTTYGGDGRTNFGLPEMRGRVAVHSGGGAGPGLTNRPLGQRSGSETNTLSIANMPSHSHTVDASTGAANQTAPTGHILATAEDADRNPLNLYTDAAADTTMATGMIQNTGGGTAVNNMQPFTVVNFIIALVGLFPSRN